MKKNNEFNWLIGAAIAVVLVFASLMIMKGRKSSRVQSSLAPVESEKIVIDQEALKKPAFVVSAPVAKKKYAKLTAQENQFAKFYPQAKPIRVDVASMTANMHSKRAVDLPLFGGEVAKVLFWNMKTSEGGSQVFEGAIYPDGNFAQRKPATLVVAGNFIEGSFPTKKGNYRIISGSAGQPLLVEMNPKMKLAHDKF